MTSIILVAIALAALLAGQFLYYAVLYRGRRRQVELKRRLQALSEAAAGQQQSLLRERRIARTPAVAQFLGSFASVRRLERLLLQTDLSWTAAVVLALSAGGAAAAVLVSWLVLGQPLLGLAAGAGVAVLPFTVVLNARSRRSHKLSAQLPDALDMMIRSLRAGHGVTAAMGLVAREMPVPVAVEFGRCYEEQRFGVSSKDAIRAMAERVATNADLKMFAVSVIIQHETGGNLVEILEKISGTIRERFKFYGKLRALTVEAKMSAVILGSLPFVCALAVLLLNPTYLTPLVDDRIGHAFLAVGVGLWLMGMTWMRRLARVDY